MLFRPSKQLRWRSYFIVFADEHSLHNNNFLALSLSFSLTHTPPLHTLPMHGHGQELRLRLIYKFAFGAILMCVYAVCVSAPLAQHTPNNSLSCYILYSSMGTLYVTPRWWCMWGGHSGEKRKRNAIMVLSSWWGGCISLVFLSAIHIIYVDTPPSILFFFYTFFLFLFSPSLSLCRSLGRSVAQLVSF